MGNLSERGETVNHTENVCDANVTYVAGVRGNQMSKPVAAVALIVLAVAPFRVAAATWSRASIRQLPDSAFAVVEQSPGGKQTRRLPHHDATGALDLPHLCNAVARLSQVKWHDPANAEIARRHLREHLDQIDRGACRPVQKPTS